MPALFLKILISKFKRQCKSFSPIHKIHDDEKAVANELIKINYLLSNSPQMTRIIFYW